MFVWCARSLLIERVSYKHFQVGADMKDWILSQKGDRWSVKYGVRNLGCHLDTTFRGWSATLAARVRLVISRLVLIFDLPLDFYGRVHVVRCCLHGVEASLLASDSLRRLRSSIGWFGLVVSPWPAWVPYLAFWMGLLGVTLLFV